MKVACTPANFTERSYNGPTIIFLLYVGRTVHDSKLDQLVFTATKVSQVGKEHTLHYDYVMMMLNVSEGT